MIKTNNLYFDTAATTPLDLRVADYMHEINKDIFGNPSSIHQVGQKSHNIIERSRKKIAELLHCKQSEIYFTSGGSESNNIALRGVLKSGDHLITASYEHPAILDVAEYLESIDIEVTYVKPNQDGIVEAQNIKKAIKSNTKLVSIMAVNNELGTINPVNKISDMCKEHGIYFHTDAVQYIGKKEMNLELSSIDMLSLGAHKFYGPQGIGALYMRKAAGCGVIPLHYGGEQENWIRPGTLPVHQIIGFGVAAELALERSEDDYLIMQDLHKRLWSGLKSIPGIEINGTIKSKYPGILNVSISGIDGESLILLLEPLCVANGSACNSKNNEPSFVLKALGRSDLQAQSAIRFSFNRNTTYLNA